MKMNSKSGFSLVELMVVVAIIGVLASIAVPNYRRFQAKARQSEPKVKLSAIYTAEQAFQLEHRFYTSGLAHIGYAEDAGTVPVYSVGFSAAYAPRAAGCTTCPTTDPDAAASFLQAATTGLAQNAVGTATAAQGAFTAASGGNLATMGGSGADIWTINNARLLVNTTPGL